jgi:hypothetical protein
VLINIKDRVEAEKLLKTALSALTFDDVSTCVSYLHQALAVLGRAG